MEASGVIGSMIKNDKVDLWKGDFGDEYTKRNTITDEHLYARTQLWDMLINVLANDTTCPKLNSILEIGAGSGINLQAIDTFRMTDARTMAKLYAVEPNENARKNIIQTINNVKVYDDNILTLNCVQSQSMDLVFTSGVLIHIHPDNLLQAMTNIYRVSSRFIICIEYFTPDCRAIAYRGEKEALWSNDFGKLYLDNFSLRCVTYGFVWKPVSGLDNLTYWIFEKVT